MAKKDLTALLKKNTREMSREDMPVSSSSDPVKAIEVPAVSSANEKKPVTTQKKKVGRPKTKTEPERTINISVPVSILEKMDVAKVKYGNNLTKYVNAIIKADLDQNYEKYLEIQNILNS